MEFVFFLSYSNVIADSLSRPNQFLGLEWTLEMNIFLDLQRKGPVVLDLLRHLFHHCGVIFAPTLVHKTAGVDAMLQF